MADVNEGKKILDLPPLVAAHVGSASPVEETLNLGSKYSNMVGNPFCGSFGMFSYVLLYSGSDNCATIFYFHGFLPGHDRATFQWSLWN